MFRKRSSGVLMHITSLPSPYGIGDMGPDAFRFVDFLEQAQQSLWQVLPININNAITGFSPYNCLSAFAGHPLLISPQQLFQDGWLDHSEILNPPKTSIDRVMFSRIEKYKLRLLRHAFTRFKSAPPPHDYLVFRKQQAFWLDDFALFSALQKQYPARLWNAWPKALRDRRIRALKEATQTLSEEIEFHCFCQYIFFQQYHALHDYCKQAGIQLIGDIPIYVAYNSADVWAHAEYFKLTASKKPTFKSGVPPDYFSRTGQLWGNPVYNWKRMQKDEYGWFIDRIGHNLQLFDQVRIDHFRGLVDFWEVPAGHTTAIRGRWTPGPGADLFHALYDRLPSAQLFAEDLGFITPDVRDLMQRFQLPGMSILQFGFGGNPRDNEHCMHNVGPQTIVYTGTHDNNTSRGWFSRELTKKQQKLVSQYIGHKVSATTVARDMMRLAYQSQANISIVPMQDILNLGQDARMNVPGTARGNWRWRMRRQAASARLADNLATFTTQYGRS